MSSIGRNDRCYCGSGKKYKYCCMDKEILPNYDNDLFVVSTYSSKAFEKAELDKFSRFFIETTADEKFEIRKIGRGYVIIDIVPPTNTILVKDYRTVELNDIQLHKLIKYNSQFELIDIGDFSYFNGIAEGGNFTWESVEGFTSSKGKINKLFIRQVLGHFILNVNLFPTKEEFIPVDEFINKGFSIYTQTNIYDIKIRDEKFYFEDVQVYAILSIYDKESLNMDEMIGIVSKEYNVSFDIALGKPFFILKVEEQGLKISVINEKVVDVKGLMVMDNE